MRILLLLLSLTSLVFSQMSLEEIVQLSNSGRGDEALKKVSVYLQRAQRSHRGYFVKALILTDKKDYSSAVSVLENAIRLSSLNPEYYRLSGQLNENLNRTAKAISAWGNCKKYASGSLKLEAEKHLRYLSNE